MHPKRDRMRPGARLQYELASLLLPRAKELRRKVGTLADLSTFFDWQEERFGRIDAVRTKKDVWRAMAALMRASGEAWHVLEFGVAWGYAEWWWLRRHDASVISTWDGFDRFTGLPRAWRELPEGAFDAGGRTPRISDPRITWHVGDVERTVKEVDLDRFRSGRRLVYFDLDIYEPSKVAWDWIAPVLRTGDIVYFDEAHDIDERRLLDESVLPSRDVRLIAASATEIALEVRS